MKDWVIFSLLSCTVFLLVGYIIGSKQERSQPQEEQDYVRDEVVDTNVVAPYWTVYGQPTYWPTYLSPYWYYGVPWYGPIGGGGYTGVAHGGGGGHGGGGHGGGGHGGAGGGGHGGGGHGGGGHH